jgi:hypothetical protein
MEDLEGERYVTPVGAKGEDEAEGCRGEQGREAVLESPIGP